MVAPDEKHLPVCVVRRDLRDEAGRLATAEKERDALKVLLDDVDTVMDGVAQMGYRPTTDEYSRAWVDVHTRVRAALAGEPDIGEPKEER